MGKVTIRYSAFKIATCSQLAVVHQLKGPIIVQEYTCLHVCIVLLDKRNNKDWK